MRIPISPIVAALLAAGCIAPASQGPDPIPAESFDTDIVRRILEERSQPPEDAFSVMNALERLLPSWQSAQRRGRAEPIERELTRRVVVSFEDVLRILRDGPHERRLVAAWALGFARVPENDLGLASPHAEALAALLPLLRDAPDDLLRNALLGVWMLADPATPIRPLTDIVLNHHDADARSNACLALLAVLTPERAPSAHEAVLVALTDPEDRVRLHASEVARRFPAPALTTQLQAVVREEGTPLVLASMVRALGAAGDRSSAPLFVYLLESPREVVAQSARLALIALFGVDRGARRSDWQDLLPSP